MALTLLGADLTEQHRIAQVRNAALWISVLHALLPEIDSGNIDGSFPEWAALATVLLHEGMQSSQLLSTSYLDAYRDTEGHPGGPLVAPGLELLTAVSRAEVLAPLAKKRIGEGQRPQEAIDASFWQLVGGFYRDLLSPGRAVLDQSALANPASIGWRRVPDANPCAFCALLATRGPAYNSARSAGEGRQFHPNCGCSIEEVFGHWEPDARVQRMIDLYESAHESGMTGKQTVAAMRAKGHGVINDAHLPEDERQKPGPKRKGDSAQGASPRTQAGGAGGGSKPPPRIRGMLGPDTPDEFPEFNGWRPDVRRSEIQEFDLIDAEILLDGDGTPGGHGYHRSGLGIKDSEFPAGWGKQEVADWVNGIIDHPTDGRPLDDAGEFTIHGESDGVEGALWVRQYGDWIIATGHPQGYNDWRGDVE